MAASDSEPQTAFYFGVAFISAAYGIFWYFRGIIYKKYFAWMFNIVADLNKDGIKDEKTRIFQFVHDYKNKQNKDLTVLEVGSGSLSNLPFLPPNSKLVCLEPNEQFDKYTKENLKKEGSSLSVDIVHGHAEKMPFEDESFDVLVCTLVLCSVRDMKKCLQEFKRVLRPGGKYVFWEHVVYEDNTSWVWTFQWMVNSLQRLVFDNCEANRDIETYIMAARISDVNLKRFPHEHFLFYFRPCISGIATK